MNPIPFSEERSIRLPEQELEEYRLPTGYTHELLDKAGSTQDIVSKQILTGYKVHHGVVVQAFTQSSGRGTHGRTWQSPTGNLYMSMIVEPKKLHPRMVALIAVLAVMETAREFGVQRQDTWFKLPNDVMVEDKKVCGILCEKVGVWYNLGIGVNIHVAPKVGDGRNAPGSLGEYGWPADKTSVDFLEAFLPHFEMHYRAAQNDITHVWGGLNVMGRDNQLTVRYNGDELKGEFTGFKTVSPEEEYLVLHTQQGQREMPLRESRLRLLDGRWTGLYGVAPKPGA